MKTRFLFAFLAGAGLSAAAFAHPGHPSAAAGFFSGFAHPVGGLDHLLAMLAVGLYAARQPGAQRWALPAVESGIALSVLVLGLLIALAVRLPLGAALALIAGFALFHGHAHHAEIDGARLSTYVVGFTLATALLHGAGWLLAQWAPQSAVARALHRVAGAAIATTGLVLLGA